ncbi:MAG: transglycosylase domain-containing protein [Cyanobacteria bacterium P01_H01_bin.15]
MLSQTVSTVRSQFDFQSSFRPGARVAEIRIRSARSRRWETFPLAGDYYTLGRSSRQCNILVRSDIVSQVHCVIERDPENRCSFRIRDKDSTNGIYAGDRRYNIIDLRHGDRLTLGPPQLKDAVQVHYRNPAPVWMLLLRWLLSATGLVGLLFIAALILQWQKVPVRPLPTGISGPVVVYAGDDKTPLNPQSDRPHRELKRLSDFSPYLPNAVIASEDSRFYWHPGVDPIGVLRAVTINLGDSGERQGASTLTQQLARSLFTEVGRENTLARKLREAIVALKLELLYSKNDILLTYINRVYLGGGNHGFEDAAQFYFDKSAADLDLSEAATLVAMLPAPNSFNPVQDYETSVGLRNRILERMALMGFISGEEANRARRSRIEVSPKAKRVLSQIQAPYFFTAVFGELSQLLGDDLAAEGNFIIETALDLSRQQAAEKLLKNWVATAGSQYQFDQGAIVSLNPQTGEVLALVGGVDFAQSQYNRATQARRQPGSTFKAFVFAAALVQGLSPQRSISCEGLSWGGVNYKACERSEGSVDMYQGFARSENAVALRLAKEAGLKKVSAIAKELGVQSELAEVPGLAIGQSEVSVLEMTGAYGALFNQGVWESPHLIKRVRDGGDCTEANTIQSCRVIYEHRLGGEQVLSEAISRTMLQLLQGVVRGGTGTSAALGLDEGGKTGTTDNGVDLWFIGGSPSRQLVTGIWLGNDDSSPTNGSSTQAAALWQQVMRSQIN